MATAGSIYQPQGWSQRNQRQDQTFTDDHGREWFGSVEIKTGHVCGLLEPQFQAPLIPDQKYLERIPKRPYDLHINYDRWLADIRATRAEWEREGRQMMRKMRGSGYDPSEEFGADVLDIIGEPPEAVEPVIAARQGNSWILGLTNRVDRRLIKYFNIDKLPAKVRREQEPDLRDLDVIEAEREALERHDRERQDIGRVKEDEPDLRDEDGDEEVDPRVERAERQQTAPRVPVQRNRPEPRGSSKGTGSRKGHSKGEKAARRPQYPKGHPKAGQWIPQAESA